MQIRGLDADDSRLDLHEARGRIRNRLESECAEKVSTDNVGSLRVDTGQHRCAGVGESKEDRGG